MRAVNIAVQRQRGRQVEVYIVDTRVGGAGLGQPVDRLGDMILQQMGETDRPIGKRDIRVVRVEPDALFL
jgi:hypothetical protein